MQSTRSVVAFLIGLGIAMALVFVALKLGTPWNPLFPLMSFVVGIVLASNFFEWMAKAHPNSSLAKGHYVPLGWRLLIFVVGFAAGYAYAT